MGGDGGSIARRSELVRTKKKQETVERDIKEAAKWRYCALSQEPLQEPIVTCPLGRLYKKEAVIRALLDKTISQIENAKHILSIKDVKELNLTKNPDFERLKADKGDTYKDLNVAQFICPVVGLEMNGKYRFCAIWSCGCVLCERALKEIKSETCQNCGKPFSMDDVIVLYGTDEEISVYSKKLEEKREKQKAEKLKKKLAAEESSTSGSQKLAVKRKLNDNSSVDKNGGKISDASSTTEKVAKTDSTTTIQNDNSKSKVYKSLFTTSESAKNQPKAHWVTYNPLYY